MKMKLSTQKKRDLRRERKPLQEYRRKREEERRRRYFK